MENDAFANPDKQALALAHAIALQESGQNGKPNYNAVGDNGTSHGAYQWQPGNYEAAAKEAGLDPTDFSPATQDKVAYYQVKKYKDQGLDPGQIASIWNSGSPDNWKDHSGTTTINGKEIHYDTPAYVNGVKKYYQQLTASQTPSYNPKPYSTGAVPGLVNYGAPSDTPSTQEGDGGLVGQLSKRGTDIAETINKATSGKMGAPIISAPLQIAGSLAGGVGDVTNAALGLIPGVKEVEKGIGQGVENLAQTPTGQSVVQAYESFANKHPELANDIGAAANIATAVPILRGVGAIKDVVGSGIGAALHGSEDAVFDAVSPRLTGKALQQAIETQGTTNKGFLGKTVLNPDRASINAANAVKENVPKFNPEKPLTYNIAATKNAVNKLASNLKSEIDQAASGRIYSFQELNSYLHALPKPTLLVGDMEKVYDKVINKAVEIAKENGGKVSSLLDTRKAFDSFIGDEFPNLYNSDVLTPMRVAVKNIRNGLTKFTAQNLPEGFGLQEKLLTQHNLLNAIENMASKAAIGATKEIGSTIPSRFLGKHPLIRAGLKGAARAIETGIGVKGAESLIP